MWHLLAPGPCALCFQMCRIVLVSRCCSPCGNMPPTHSCLQPQINALPTVYELVSGRAQGVAAAEAKAARVVRRCAVLRCAVLC